MRRNGNKHAERGFTLIELLIVVAIIAILALIAAFEALRQSDVCANLFVRIHTIRILV